MPRGMAVLPLTEREPVYTKRSYGIAPALHKSDSFFEVQALIAEHVKRGIDYESYRKTPEELKAIKNKAVRAYYVKLNEQLDYFQEVDEVLTEGEGHVAHTLASEGDPLLPITRANAQAKADEQDRKTKVYININFAVNVLLLGAKIAVVIISSSLSLLASAVDSFMDFLSTLIIFFTARASGQSDPYKYPLGKSRMEPIGVVVFSVCMIVSFAQVGVESVQRLFNKHLELVDLPPTAIGAMVTTVAVKFVMWIWCRSFKSTSIQALAQDAKNDVVFNIFSLLFPFIGRLVNWPYLDPLGALLLSIYIITEWVETLWECIQDLVGCRADPMQHQRVIWLVTRFSPLILAVQYVNVFTAGGGFIVEVDVVLPKDISLPRAHDIAESVQYSLESLDGINRAYVHVDYNPRNPSGHQIR